jgi:hypothetical protein
MKVLNLIRIPVRNGPVLAASIISGFLLIASIGKCASGMIPNVDWHVHNAFVILKVRPQTDAEEKKNPSPNGYQRMAVTEVLKGVV